MDRLVKRAQCGEAEAFIQLIEENRMMLERIAFGYFLPEADVADAIQDTILSAYEHLKELRKPQYFRTWLVRILMNHCNSRCRQIKRNCPVENVPEISQDGWEESNIEFFDMLRSLPKDSRTIFQLYYGEQFTTREIAEMLSLKESTVKSKLHRGKKQLRQELQVGRSR